MKRIFLLVIFYLIANASFAQKSLLQCSLQKNKILKEVFLNGQPDSAAIAKLVAAVNEWSGCIVGKPIPRFKEKTMAGEKIDNEFIKGKIAVINFWFIACPPCVAEIPGFNRAVYEFKDSNVVFLAFSTDSKSELKDFLAKTGFDFTVIPGSEVANSAFGISERPITFIIDPGGKVSTGWVGGETGSRAAEEAYWKVKRGIEKLLSNPSMP